MTLARVLATGVGVWLMAAPASMGADGWQGRSMHVAGPIVVALSLAAGAPALDPLRRLLIPVGGWLVLAPWVLGADRAGLGTSVIAGALVILLAWPARRHPPRRGGGWRAVAPLVRPPNEEPHGHDG